MVTAFVIMLNDSIESVALTHEAADREVIRLKYQHDEPLDEHRPYRERYIRAVETRIVK